METELHSSSDVDSRQGISDGDTLHHSNSSESNPTDLTWTQDRRYQFINEIARGGAGAIWRVFDHRLERYSAIKILLDSQDNDEMRRRLEQEEKICGRLQHPGIVPVHELNHLEGGRPFVNMKLIEGETLGEILETPNNHSREGLLNIFARICEAMAYAHDQNIIHRDLKPNNIMVGAFDEVQVMDWGLAKEIKSSSIPKDLAGNLSISQQCEFNCSETLIGSIFGTIAYMPPEQARGEIENIDKRSDVFALGGVLTAILTGLPVYLGNNTEELLLLAKQGRVDPATMRVQKSGACKRLKRLAIDCISADANKRPSDARELLHLFTDIMRPRKHVRWLIFAAAVVGLSFTIVIALMIIDFVFLTSAEVFEPIHQ